MPHIKPSHFQLGCDTAYYSPSWALSTWDVLQTCQNSVERSSEDSITQRRVLKILRNTYLNWGLIELCNC